MGLLLSCVTYLLVSTRLAIYLFMKKKEREERTGGLWGGGGGGQKLVICLINGLGQTISRIHSYLHFLSSVDG